MSLLRYNSFGSVPLLRYNGFGSLPLLKYNGIDSVPLLRFNGFGSLALLHGGVETNVRFASLYNTVIQSAVHDIHKYSFPGDALQVAGPFDSDKESFLCNYTLCRPGHLVANKWRSND